MNHGPTSAGLVGLVRAVRNDRRGHVYGLGELPPEAAPVGELGALLAEPADDTVAVWQTDDGRLVTDEVDAVGSRPPRSARRAWALAPLGFDELPSGMRYRMLGGRLRRLARRSWSKRLKPGIRGETPVGYLYRESDLGRRALYSSLHPITGDQLLSTSSQLADELGYEHNARLGYLVMTAPVTGSLRMAPATMAWTNTFGAPRPEDGSVILRGRLTRPNEKEGTVRRDNLRVSGWAILTNEPVARIDILVNGTWMGRARLGLQRPPKFQRREAPEAPIAGFDLRVPPSRVPEDWSEARVETVVSGVHGSDFVLAGDRTVNLAPPLTISAGETDGSAETRPHVAPTAGEPIRLAAFAHNLEPGGAQRTLFEQLTRLRARGDFESLVVSPEDGPWRERFEQEGIPVHLVADYPLDEDRRYVARREELASWMESERVGAVFANTLSCFIGVELAQMLGLPSLWMIHESYELPIWWNMSQRGNPDPALRQRAVRALAAADALMFPAEATRRLFEPYMRTDRVAAAACGVEFGEIDRFRRENSREEVRASLGFGEEDQVVLCLGVIEPRKGQAVLARAFALLADEQRDAKLALVGGTDSAYAAGVRRFFDTAGLDRRAQLVPATMEPFKWHMAADVFVLPSDIESAPVVLGEAMAFETPVVAASVWGVPDMITDGVHGLLCEPNDVSELAATIDRVLRMPDDVRIAIARAGRERAMEHHDPDAFQAKFETILDELIKRRPKLQAV